MTRHCLTCIWYDVTDAHVLQQYPKPARCLKHRTVQHADDTCDEQRDYTQPAKANAA